MGKHTKGPWSEKTKVCISSVPFDLRFLCSADHDKEAEANARLIAAAPEMLEALKEALDAMRKNIAYATIKDEQALAKAIPMAVEALKKAEGGEG